jgi:hypothetical protein
MNNTFTNQLAPSNGELVIVKLWEIYLLYHPSNLYKVLSEMSMDKSALQDKQAGGRIVFRFEKHVWEEEVKGLLYGHRIPVTIQSDRLHAVSTKGRQPVLR